MSCEKELQELAMDLMDSKKGSRHSRAATLLVRGPVVVPQSRAVAVICVLSVLIQVKRSRAIAFPVAVLKPIDLGTASDRSLRGVK